MKLKLNIGNNIQLPYVPQKLTNTAMMAYVAALLICLVIYQRYALEWRWMILGIIEVCGFFYFLNHNTKAWLRTTPKTFTKKLFWWGFVVRLAWVGVSYLLYNEWTGEPFSIGAADEMFYHDMALHGASMMRAGNWGLYSGLTQYAGTVAFSDMGYPLYLSIVYWLFGDSILMARIIKVIFGAWTAVLMYRLASRNFGEYTGRMTGVVCMLMPNLIYYCSLQLKEVEMVFLAMLFAERADFLLRKGKLTLLPTAALMLIPLFMFMIRTALAATLVMAFFCALLLSSGRVVSFGRRALLIVMAVIFVAIMLMTSTSIGNEVRQMWETGGSTQRGNMEWRAERKDATDGLQQRFARYAGSAVFAPMIFTIPFPTMAETPGQENQKLIHGGNFVKNIMSFFTIASLFILLFGGDWRKHVLPLAILCGYLVVLVFSNFAHSERFHQPILPLHMMFAVYGISRMRDLRWVKSGYNYWCVLMIIAAIAWNWFKLAGRGMI